MLNIPFNPILSPRPPVPKNPGGTPRGRGLHAQQINIEG